MFSKTFKEVADWYLDNMGKLGLSVSDQRVKAAAAKALNKAFGHKVLSHGQIRSRYQTEKRLAELESTLIQDGIHHSTRAKILRESSEDMAGLFRGRKKVERLDRMSIREWKIRMEQSGMSHGTLQRYLSAGSVFINTAWEEKDWDLPNPFDGMCRGLKPNIKRRTLTQEEQSAMLLALAQPWRDVCAFILETAMRDGEVINLEWERVNLSGGYITFRPDADTRNGGSKSKRGDRVYLTDEAKAIIERQPGGQYVFTRKENRIRYQTFWRAWNDARIKAGVERCTPHDLRRTVGYKLRAAGVSLDAIQSYLRHASARTTEQVYAGVKPEKAMDAVRVLNMGVIG